MAATPETTITATASSYRSSETAAMRASLPPRGAASTRREVDYLRGFRRRRAAWRLAFRRRHELPLHRAPSRRILLFEDLDIRNLDCDDRIGGACRSRAVRDGLQDQARMIWISQRGILQLLQGRAQVGPVVYQERPVMAVLQYAVEETV